jgi:RNA polymerase sigma-70 factor (family 1)
MNSSSYDTYSDGELLELLRTGDQFAFTGLYDRYYQKIYRHIFTLVQLPELTEDIVHEVFMKLWEIRGELDIKVKFHSFIYRMAHNKAIDLTRRISFDRKMRSYLLDRYQSVFQEIERSSDELGRMDALVEMALDTLPPQRRKVYELIRQQGLSYKEVAEKLGVTTSTVRDHLVKASVELRKFLAERGELAVTLFLLEAIVMK